MAVWTEVVKEWMGDAGGWMSQLKQEKQAQRQSQQKVTEWALRVERTLWIILVQPLNFCR